MELSIVAMKSDTIVNCTPHPVNIYDADKNGVIANFPTSNYAPRLEQRPQQKMGVITAPNGTSICVFSPQKFEGVTGLPDCEYGDHPDIIVSMLVGQRLQETKQWSGAVYGADSGPAAVVRNEKGQIQGTTRLVQYCARQVLNRKV